MTRLCNRYDMDTTHVINMFCWLVKSFDWCGKSLRERWSTGTVFPPPWERSHALTRHLLHYTVYAFYTSNNIANSFNELGINSGARWMLLWHDGGVTTFKFVALAVASFLQNSGTWLTCVSQKRLLRYAPTSVISNWELLVSSLFVWGCFCYKTFFVWRYIRFEISIYW